MTEYDNTNSGALFKNDKKETDQHPLYKGSINIEGKDFWINAWLNTAKSGSTYMALKVTAKEQQEVKEPQPSAGSPPVDELEDEIPFMRYEDGIMA